MYSGETFIPAQLAWIDVQSIPLAVPSATESLGLNDRLGSVTAFLVRLDVTT